MLTLFPLVSLALPSQKQATPPKPKPAPAQKAVTPTTRPTPPRPTEPVKQPTQPGSPNLKSDPAALGLLTSSADSHRKLTSLQTTLDWRYLSKANLAFRPISAQGQKALEGALRSAQGTLTLTRDGQARLEVTTPGKDARSEGRLLSVEAAGVATVAGVACTAVTATLRQVVIESILWGEQGSTSILTFNTSSGPFMGLAATAGCFHLKKFPCCPR